MDIALKYMCGWECVRSTGQRRAFLRTYTPKKDKANERESIQFNRGEQQFASIMCFMQRIIIYR